MFLPPYLNTDSLTDIQIYAMHIKMKLITRIRSFISAHHHDVQEEEVCDVSQRCESPTPLATTQSSPEDVVLPSEEPSPEITTSNKEIQKPEVTGSFSQELKLHGKTLLEVQSTPIDLFPIKKARFPLISELVWFKSF
ncbi:hypothetical protein DFH28DRAFT_1169330 [Melampsora americana]|nr:hypothetical protein DFH28DRAFT_1169330 [Melampsora americana]